MDPLRDTNMETIEVTLEFQTYLHQVSVLSSYKR